MSIEIGRQGYLGLAIEATPGDAESTPDIFVPFTENSLEEKHEPLMDISSRASRQMNHDAVTGKKWGEGSVSMYLDATNLGYLLKMAFGNEALTQKNAGPPSVDDHLFYATVSGNAPKTATLWLYRGSGPSVKQFTYAVIDSMTISVGTDGIPTAEVNFLTDFPTEVAAPTLTTTSGTILTWQDLNLRFGDTPAQAAAATATAMSAFNMTINNNAEAIYRTGISAAGDSTPDVIRLGELEVTGDYTLFLENDTELNKYTGLTKKSMEAKFTGAGLGSGYTELLTILAKHIVLNDKSIDTGLSDFFAMTGNFTAIGNRQDPGFVDITLRNGKATVYS